MTDERVLVLGIGNPLMMDEGIGVRVVETLMATLEFPPNVTLVDAGTMGMSILGLFRDCDYMLVIDAMKDTGEPPGTVVRLSAEELAPNQVMHSLHDARLTDVLEAALLMGLEPEVACIGVQVQNIAQWHLELSPVVEAAVPHACDAVADALTAWGVTLAERTEPTGEDARIIAALRTKDSMPEG